MLRMAAGGDCKDERDDIAESIKVFLNCDNTALAMQELYDQFRSKGLGDVCFAHGTVKALYNGMLQYSDGSTPSNLSLFAFIEQNSLMQDEIQNNALKLTLVNQVGNDQSLSKIAKSAKQEVYLPETFKQIENQVGLGTAAYTIVMGKESKVAE